MKKDKKMVLEALIARVRGLEYVVKCQNDYIATLEHANDVYVDILRELLGSTFKDDLKTLQDVNLVPTFISEISKEDVEMLKNL